MGRDRIRLRQVFKGPRELRANVETCCCVLLGYDTKKRTYPHHSLDRLNRQTEGADWLLEEWNEEVDVTKVMIAL
jgi:hypothetical protein